MDEPKKLCPGCKKKKPRSAFWKLKKAPDGCQSRCIECMQGHKKSALGRSNRRRWERNLREEVLKHYGGKCACCKERMYEFLAIDHINGGGNKHRKQIKTPMPYWLKKNGFPPGYRILCHNCNVSLGRYGYCPHQPAI